MFLRLTTDEGEPCLVMPEQVLCVTPTKHWLKGGGSVPVSHIAIGPTFIRVRETQDEIQRKMAALHRERARQFRDVMAEGEANGEEEAG